MIWALFGILHSFFRAGFAEINHIYRVDGGRLNFWHAVFGMAFLVPFLPFVERNMPVGLYIAAMIVGLVLTAGGLMQLILSSQKSGRVTGMFIPVEAIAAFMLWYLFTPETEALLLSSASKTALTGLAFVLATVGLLRIRDNDAGWKEFAAILPGAVALGGSAVLIKLVVLPTMLPHAAFTFAFVAYAVMALLMGFVVLIRKEADQAFIDTKLIHAGLMTGIFSASAFVFFIYSLAYAPNPAYPAVLLMTSPVWLWLYHKLKKEEDHANPVFAVMILAGAALLIGTNL